jgi:hypothetical protein
MHTLKFIFSTLLIILISGCTTASQNETAADPKWIVTLWGESANLSEIDATHYTFTLTSPASNVLLWTDRPDHLSANVPVAAVVNLSDWNNLYSEALPNAALSVKDSNGNRYLKTLVLSEPTLVLEDSGCILDSNYSCAITTVTWNAELVPLNGTSTASPQYTNVSTIQGKALESISITFAHATNQNASSLYNNFRD